MHSVMESTSGWHFWPHLPWHSRDLDLNPSSSLSKCDEGTQPVCLLFVCLNLFIYLFIFGHVGSSLLRASFLLVVVSGGYSSLQCVGFSLQWLLLLRSTGSRRAGFSSCGSWALERRLCSCGTRA